ncbi:MAG: hypothetical protein QNK23_17795 [Crocinitomicaceae bacterium]|nr:hypothetical protein [Crocinitomicaceae bacterium]
MLEYKGNIEIYYPDTVKTLGDAPQSVKIKKVFLSILIAIFLGGVIVGVGYAGEQNWLKITGYIVGGVILVGGILISLNSKISNCLYCEHELGKTLDDTMTKQDENEKIECGNCHEWMISHEGSIRAFTQEDTEIYKKSISAPVFEAGGLQNECVICGAPPINYEKAKKTKMNAERLLVGRLSVSTASIGNIPYCSEHTGAVELEIKEDYLRLTFPKVDMMKRYLAFNEGKMEKMIKVQNKVQKVVKKIQNN